MDFLVFLTFAALSSTVSAHSSDTCSSRISLPIEDVRQLATANNYLAFNLYRKLTFEVENVIFSPFSVSSAFSALFYGTKGKAAQELRVALGYEAAKLENESVHVTFFYFLTEILPKYNNFQNVINTACVLLVNKDIRLIAEYKYDVQNVYQAYIRNVDFKEASVIEKVNQWVKVKTNGKIDRLLSVIDPSMAFVLLTASYFKGTWKSKFDFKDTKLKPFYNGGLNSGMKKVPTMHLAATLRYADFFEDSFQAVELPYRGNDIRMILLLPDSNAAMSDLEKRLTPKNFTAIRRQMYYTAVNLSLPKFKVNYTRELSEYVQALGIQEVFRPTADFSGMTLSAGVSHLSHVSHQAYIDVYEEGSEAASLTAFITTRMMPVSEDVPTFRVDRPFIFSIIDHKSSMVLFLGRVHRL